jgi:hypothetical protein
MELHAVPTDSAPLPPIHAKTLLLTSVIVNSRCYAMLHQMEWWHHSHAKRSGTQAALARCHRHTYCWHVATPYNYMTYVGTNATSPKATRSQCQNHAQRLHIATHYTSEKDMSTTVATRMAALCRCYSHSHLKHVAARCNLVRDDAHSNSSPSRLHSLATTAMHTTSIWQHGTR